MELFHSLTSISQLNDSIYCYTTSFIIMSQRCIYTNFIYGCPYPKWDGGWSRKMFPQSFSYLSNWSLLVQYISLSLEKQTNNLMNTLPMCRGDSPNQCWATHIKSINNSLALATYSCSFICSSSIYPSTQFIVLHCIDIA